MDRQIEGMAKEIRGNKPLIEKLERGFSALHKKLDKHDVSRLIERE